MRAGLYLILVPWMMGKVGIGHDGERVPWSPSDTEIDTALVLHAAAVGETLAKERIIAIAVETLQDHEREVVGRLPCRAVERGHGPTVARSRLAGNLQTVAAVAVADAGIPESDSVVGNAGAYRVAAAG